jgi:hypothetical protein
MLFLYTGVQGGTAMISRLPETELSWFEFAEAHAEAMAAGGHIARGFLLLAKGLRHARAAWEAQEPWGKELAWRYQEAMDVYSERHAMKTAGVGSSLWRVTLPEPGDNQTQD